ncbi:2-dehydropantoate 2-reductase [Salinibacillus kushneri]|uniref:2-dehydropantoate 2-reductase n=1 Tax=Salinibacillus kushneri TaxID=237682 RepID=A0A1H9ZDI3_9BACI|nr:2-dehydropantoate 2-reductase [Salinibacillus kushneri]SES79387.1 2-dehydropantoate 2-reductase [Salinibacillus kushneri]
MRIGVAGAGAVGSYFGGMLHNAGHDVTFLARGYHLAAMKTEGLLIAGEHGQFRVPGTFTDRLSDLAKSDLVLLCVKSNDTEEVAKQLRNILKNSALIMTMQNGVENEEILEDVFDKERLLSAATYIQASVEAPGRIRQQGRVKLVIGELDSSATDDCAVIMEKFNQAGIDTVQSRHILERKWQKLLWNATFNPLSAAAVARVGQILDDKQLNKTASAICSEVINVAIHKGISFDPEPTQARIFSNAEKARNHQTSMLQDRLRGKRMEVEAMCGYIVRQANLLDVSTPALQSIYSVLSFIDQANKSHMKMK